MTTATNRFNTAITATDETEPGIKGATNRYRRMSRETSRFARQSAAEIRRSGLGDLARSFGVLEKASARAFGSGSITGGLAQRLGGIGEASRFAGGAMARAARQGGALGGALTGVGMAAAGTAGVMLAAGVASIGLIKHWSNSGAQLGRLSLNLGVATRDLQQFQGAAERAGISKDSMAGALGGIGSSIHAGLYGQNPEALAALNKLGIPIKRKADGTVDITAMTLALADATSRIKDPYAQAHLANIFGFQEALPLMRKGSAAIRADMGDVDRYGSVLSERDIARAARIQREAILVKQRGERELMNGGELLSRPAEGMISGFNDLVRDPAGVVGGIGQRIGERLDRNGRSAPRRPGDVRAGGRGTLASRIEHQESRGNQNAVSPKGAIGAMQLMPDTARAAAARLGIPYDEQRLRTDKAYNQRLGQEELRHLLQRYGGDELLASAAYNAGPGAVDRWLRRFGDPRGGGISHEAFASKIPYGETRDYVHKVGAVPQQPVRHVHEFRGLPSGVSVTTRTEGAGGVSIGQAMPPGL